MFAVDPVGENPARPGGNHERVAGLECTMALEIPTYTGECENVKGNERSRTEWTEACGSRVKTVPISRAQGVARTGGSRRAEGDRRPTEVVVNRSRAK